MLGLLLICNLGVLKFVKFVKSKQLIPFDNGRRTVDLTMELWYHEVVSIFFLVIIFKGHYSKIILCTKIYIWGVNKYILLTTRLSERIKFDIVLKSFIIKSFITVIS